MAMDLSVMIELAEAALRIGIQGYAIAKRLNAEGYEVPSLDTFEKETQELRDLPDLTPQHEGD